MSVKRDVSLSTALRYKGNGPFLTYILHRIGGLGMAIFIAMHLTASFLESQNLRFVSRIGDLLNDVYINPFFQLFIFFCIFFHAINGLRIIILDLFPKLIKYYRQAIWLEWMFFIPIYGFAVFVIISSELATK
jgi:succinate dehydrogenase / fumarate reductase, cytochrome b subunit